jgi:8-oxo-dGTP diphosphatase
VRLVEPHIRVSAVPYKRWNDASKAPTFTVGWSCSDERMHNVVVGALVREGRVLLVHRRPDKRANPDVWDLPGGLIEAGESELEALARELDEELGVQIATGAASHLCRLTTGPVEELALVSAWLVPDWQGSPANEAPDEHDDIGWFSLQDLPPPPHVIVRTALLEALGTPGG